MKICSLAALWGTHLTGERPAYKWDYVRAEAAATCHDPYVFVMVSVPFGDSRTDMFASSTQIMEFFTEYDEGRCVAVDDDHDRPDSDDESNRGALTANGPVNDLYKFLEDVLAKF